MLSEQRLGHHRARRPFDLHAVDRGASSRSRWQSGNRRICQLQAGLCRIETGPARRFSIHVPRRCGSAFRGSQSRSGRQWRVDAVEVRVIGEPELLARTAARRGARGQPQVIENLARGARILDEPNHPHRAGAARADQHVERPRAPQQFRPVESSLACRIPGTRQIAPPRRQRIAGPQRWNRTRIPPCPRTRPRGWAVP
jgi:hypothetical protein